jgi:hypothetical protein
MGTVRSKLEILVEAILKGTGLVDAQKGMAETGSAADQMATHMDAASAASHRLAAAEAVQQRAARELRDAQRALAEYVGNVGEEAQRDLEQAVIDAKEAMEKADREVDEAKRGLQQLGGEVDDTGGRFKKFGLTLVDMKAGLDMATGALRGVIDVAREGYEFARAGAMADRATTAFENLSGGALAGRDNLQAMLEATDNTLDSLSAMEASSKLMSMGLAGNADELGELAEMAVTLGRAFGRDATQALDEFGLLLANRSILRLDTFGIASGRVRERVNELTKAGLDADAAFKEATFEEGRKAMERLGETGGAAADDMEKLEAAITDVKTEATLAVSELLELSGAAKKVHEVGQALELDRLIREARDLGVLTTEAEREIRKAVDLAYAPNPAARQKEWERAARETADAINELQQAISGHNEAMRKAQPVIDYYAQQLNEARILESGRVITEHDWSAALDMAAASTKTAIIPTEQLLAAQREQYYNETELNAKMLDRAATTKTQADANAKLKESQDAVNEATQEYIDAIDEIADRAFEHQTDLIDDLIDAQEDLDEAQGDWVQTYRDNSAVVGEISDQLARDLDADQRQAQEDIVASVEEGSAEWLAAYNALQNDLTDSQRAGLVARKAELEGAHGDVVSYYTGDAEAAEEAQGRIDKAMEEIARSYREMVYEGIFLSQIEAGNFTEDMAETAVGLGLLTQEQADMMLEAARVKTILTEAMTDYRDELDALDPGVLEEFVEIIASGESSSITGALIMAQARVGDVKEAIDGPDGLRPTMEQLGEPVTGFRETVDTEVAGVRENLGGVRQDLDDILARMGELDGKQVNARVNLELSGEAAAMVQEARAHGWNIE